MKQSAIITIFAMMLGAVTLNGAESVKPVVTPSPETSTVSANATDKAIQFTDGSRPLAEYRFGDVNYKPYIEKLCTPSGRNVLRDSPHDHVHHHSLMMAFSIDGCDFWSERGEDKNGTPKDRFRLCRCRQNRRHSRIENHLDQDGQKADRH